VPVWGLVDLSLLEVIEFFPTERAAVEALREVLIDEPSWKSILRVERIDIGGEINLN
jgi:hypothetical protein